MKIDIKQVSKLANLTLSEKELTQFKDQLQETINYIDQLNEVDTKGIESTSQVTGLENVVREDTVGVSLTQKEALSNGPKIYKSYFQVKGIFEDE